MMVSVDLAEMPVGRSWLTNFPTSDERNIASLILENIQLITLQEMYSRLSQTLVESAANGSLVHPITMVPVLDGGDLSRVRALVGTPIEIGDKRTGGGVQGEKHAVPPLISSSPGSEALMGKFIRDFVSARKRAKDDQWSDAGTEIEKLRSQRVRTLAILTDSIGTGSQVESFAKHLSQNKTIRSWRSGKFMRIVAVSMSGTLAGVLKLRTSRYVDDVICLEPALDLKTAPLNDMERRSITALCEKYGRLRDYKLGYGGAAMLTAFEHGVPNTMPCIIWQDSRKWKPLFGAKSIPEEVIRAAARAPQSGSPATTSLLGPATRILLYLAKGPRTQVEIAFGLGMSDRVSNEKLYELLTQNLIKRKREARGYVFEVTEKAKVELNTLFPTRRTRPLPLISPDAYYPQSLR